MRKLIPFLVLSFAAFALAQDGPLTNGANIPVRTDANGYLLSAAQTYSGPDGPRRVFANTLVRTDANGYLIVTNPTGFGSPLDAQYWVGAANASLTAEKNLGALATALVVNTAGVPSAYAGVTCTNQFLRALSAVGASTCATVSLTDTSGIAPSDAGYWVDTANATLSAERNLGLLTTGLVLNTVTAAVGVPSTYAGTSCTNQFPRSLSASGAATCASVSLTADVTGTLGEGSGGTGSTDFTAGSVIFSNGTILTQDNANLFWDDTNNRLGVGTAAPDKTLHLFASDTTATSNANSLMLLERNANSNWIQFLGGATSTDHGFLWSTSVADAGGMWFDFNVSRFTLQGPTIRLMGTTPNDVAVLIGNTSAPSTGGAVLVFADGTAPSGLALNSAGLYANDVAGTVEMFAIDEAGNSTQISPHNFSLFTPEASEEYPASYYSLQQYLGVEVAIDLFRLARLVQQQSGVQLIHRRALPERQNWVTDQEGNMRRLMATYEAWEVARDAFVPTTETPTFTTSAPPYPALKQPPAWLRERLIAKGWLDLTRGKTLQTELTAWCQTRGC